MNHARTSSHPSSSYLSVGNNNGLIPNPGMYMGRTYWTQPAYTPQPSNTTAQGNDPYGFPPNMVPVAAPSYVPVVSSSGVGVGNAHNSFQAPRSFPNPPACVRSFIDQGTPYVASRRLQHATAPAQYNQAPFSSGGFAGVLPRYPVQALYQQNMPPPISQHAYLQPYGTELTMGSASSSLLQATASSALARQKRVAEDLGDCETRKRSKHEERILDDPECVPRPDKDGHAQIKRLRCDQEMTPDSHRKHIETLRHQGLTEGELICDCGKPYNRVDALEGHWRDSACGRKRKMRKQPSSSTPSQGSMSSASPVAIPRGPFTFRAPATAASMTSDLTPSKILENMHILPQAIELTPSQKTIAPADLFLPATANGPLLPAPVESVDPAVSALFGEWASAELKQFPPQAIEVPRSQETDVIADPFWAAVSPDQVAELMQFFDFDSFPSEELPQN
ncbi:uncharacterized protein EDB91DRAFT_1127773 [Suillus paluster]|uniref:uncharacterized protein n=1 Tax=Suillus paluster TaxID=48578 RepID=UPI001B87944F|nr:uncharacterized protein EDB91DRAFT_1127773 [Suillus paluster]KAG1742735.1 hypothetical protein EDB91DRAFT_1127773 [Suillus paluster]